MYIHEREDWPIFRWDNEFVLNCLIPIRHQQGLLLGRMKTLGFDLKNEAVLHTLTQDILKSSEIEGEHLDQTAVRSSVARRLGIETVGITKIDRSIEGVVEMMLDATQNYQKPLTKERLFSWHASLFPTGYSGLTKIDVGQWRDQIMQVVSGPIGRERVHFEAPDPERVEHEMLAFLDWYAMTVASDLDPILKAAVAHLWFVTIHPFDDGNGRIGRALIDHTLARAENSPQRFYSLSSEIQKNTKGYYAILEGTQKGDLNITPWLTWFIDCYEGAIQGAHMALDVIFHKAAFWQSLCDKHINERQKKMINLLLDGFEGKLTTSKYAKITKCSQDTAYRDILDLIEQEVLSKNIEGGRSSSYSLVPLSFI